MLNILVCPSPFNKLQPIFSLIVEVINIVKIIVPILLIVYGMLDFSKAVMGKDDGEIKKAQGIFIKRAIYAVAIFFVITIVTLATNLLVKYVDKNTDVNAESWIDCLNLTKDEANDGYSREEKDECYKNCRNQGGSESYCNANCNDNPNFDDR